MNRKSLAVLLTVIMLFALMPAPALANVGDVFTDTATGITYKVLTESGNTGTVQVGSGSSRAVNINTMSLTIPATVLVGANTYTVTSIGEGAFSYCASLTSVTMTNVTKIGAWAFSHCASLTNVTMPNVTRIGASAFYSCTSLISMNMPKVTSIDQQAFANCKKLALTALPAGVTSINRDVFYGCEKLALTALPASLTSIGVGAFDACESLALTALPSGVTSIGERAFSGCESLALTALPASVMSIGIYTFQGCKSLTNVTMTNVTSIGNGAFNGCENLASVAIPKVTNIGEWGFRDCASLTSINMPNVTSIGEWGFRDCASLSSITCGQTVAPTLGSNAFSGIAATGTLNIPAGATGYTTAKGWPWVAPAPAPTTPGFTITVPTAPTAPTVNNPFTETPVLNPPIITDPTENKAVTALAQSTVTFSVTAKNATSYQWYVNRNDGNGFVAILGATGASHTTPALALSDNGCQYRCVASNSDGSAISPIFTLNASETIAPPQTGDTSAPVFIGIAMLLTGFAVSILIRRRSGREN